MLEHIDICPWLELAGIFIWRNEKKIVPLPTLNNTKPNINKFQWQQKSDYNVMVARTMRSILLSSPIAGHHEMVDLLKG